MLAGPSKKSIPYTRTAGFILAAIPAVGLSLALAPSHASADTVSETPASPAATSASTSASSGTTSFSSSATPVLATSETSTTPKTITVSGAIGDLYTAMDGADGELGLATASETPLTGGGVWQQFQHGRIYWSQATGAHAIKGGIGDTYVALGDAALTKLGLPTYDEVKLPDGWYQQFQNAGIYWTNDGGKVVTGDVAAKYAALGKTASTTATASSTPSAINATSAADATTKTSSNSSAANTTSAKSTAQPTTAATSSSTPIAPGSVSASSSSSASTTNPAAAAPSTTQSPNAQTPSTQAPTSAIADATSTAQETTTVGAIAVWYNRLGGVNSYLGAPTSPEIPTTGGVYQVFQGGRIYWNEALGAYDVHGAVLLEYLSLNGSDGELGMPATPEVPVPGGTYQVFQNGWIYWSEPNGAHWLHGATLAEYQAIAGTNSYLGFPTSDERSAAGGTVQDFEHGKIYWNPSTGAHAVHGAVLTEFGNNGAEGGWLGYPTTDELLLAEGVVQHFQGGNVYWNASTGAHVVRGTIGDTYAANGWEWGFLGYPTSSERPVSNGGVVQDFQNGKIYWSPGNGAYAIHNAVLTEYQNTGWEWGILGFPTSEEQSLDNGIVQHFQGGNVYWNASTGAHVVRGTIGDTYAANGWEWGFLGYPTSSERPVSNGGVVQDFQNGKIYWSPGNGAYAIHNAVLTEYQNTGWEWGILGFPTSEEQSLDNGIVQHFQGGNVYWNASTGAHVVRGTIGDTYAANGWEWGFLGYPTSSERPVSNGGVVQDFQNGKIYWSPGNGAYAIHNAVLTEYQNTGWEWGILGFPTSEEQSLDNGIVQHFQGGNVYWNASTGAHVVRGTIGDTYAANGWEWGFLGYPTSSERPVSNGGVVQDFQNGKIYWSPGNGAYAIHNAVLTEYQNTGWEWGILGFPTSEEQSLDNGIVQHFQGGPVYWSPDVGAHAIHGEILRAYSANDWEWGPLGYPTTGELPGGEGVVQYFQKGNISWVAGRGAVVNVINTGGPKPAAGDEAGYIRWVAGFAQEEQRRYGVPAAVSIAQSILESGWGQSSLTAVDNNYFGIKCPAYGSPFVSGCTSYSTNEWVNGGYVTIQAGFRSYNSPADSFLDHGFFLSLGDPTNSANRYYPAFLTTNDRDFVRAIAAAGYATDPTYANKIIGFMDRYNLYQYDV
ncbi:Large surface protein A [Propionibacterium freudenreichii]|nr:Large surface protein A [Propionibacterium freudenreichii]SCQ63171.1 Large surface protein A [Propionibacterium freudenreichii]SCQ66023.1 Large surface protein A [Propionibacterium freudenreichii]